MASGRWNASLSICSTRLSQRSSEMWLAGLPGFKSTLSLALEDSHVSQETTEVFARGARLR